jgi:uncharacterized membrane protein
MADQELIDFSHEIKNETIKSQEPNLKLWHPEKAKMQLAYWVLAGIFIIFITSVVSNYLAKKGLLDMGLSNGLFELCKTGLLPIVTLVLGYYFSKD